MGQQMRPPPMSQSVHQTDPQMYYQQQQQEQMMRQQQMMLMQQRNAMLWQHQQRNLGEPIQHQQQMASVFEASHAQQAHHQQSPHNAAQHQPLPATSQQDAGHMPHRQFMTDSPPRMTQSTYTPPAEHLPLNAQAPPAPAAKRKAKATASAKSKKHAPGGAGSADHRARNSQGGEAMYAQAFGGMDGVPGAQYHFQQPQNNSQHMQHQQHSSMGMGTSHLQQPQHMQHQQQTSMGMGTSHLQQPQHMQHQQHTSMGMGTSHGLEQPHHQQHASMGSHLEQPQSNGSGMSYHAHQPEHMFQHAYDLHHQQVYTQPRYGDQVIQSEHASAQLPIQDSELLELFTSREVDAALAHRPSTFGRHVSWDGGAPTN